MEPLLRVEQLQISFKNETGTALVIPDISFSVFENEFVAIVGESGSGKSLTALSVMQLLPPNAIQKGVVFFKGKNISKSEEQNIKNIRGKEISMIFQEPMTSLNPLLTCGNQITEVLVRHLSLSKKDAAKKALSLFTTVELPDPSAMLHRYPHEISGGQKQRVMIAMAMACDPALIIADEPTTALDVLVQANILSLLKKISVEKGLSVLLITHDLGIVADVADKLIVMQKGTIVEEGRAKEVLTAPKHVYTKALMACRPSANDKYYFLPEMKDLMIQERVQLLHKPLFEQHEKIILEVKDLEILYSKKSGIFSHTVFQKVVNKVSFQVHEKEIVGLVGESGCGKTTIGKAILKLIEVSSGSILLEEKDLTVMSEKEMRPLRKKLQVVFQDPYSSLNPLIKIGDAIAEPLKVHGIGKNAADRKKMVMEMLNKLELSEEHYNRYPHEFSGGQRQRICIARALILQPSFVIFDESVSALDVSIQAQVLNIISRLKEEMNFSAIFISHDLSVVHHLCDRILVMHKGVIVESGNADNIYNSPKHSYTKKLVNAIPGKDLMAG